MISACTMIPEQRTPPNHLICNGNSRVANGLDYSIKLCINGCEKRTMENETNNEETKLDCSCMPLVSQNLVPSPLSDLSDTNAIPCENISEESLLLSSQKKNNRPSFHAHKPAEVFRTDLISAMKIPDTAFLPCEDYLVMQDPWRIEWEKGVQVPVNYDVIPQICVWKIKKEAYKDFKIPRKMIRSKPKSGDKTTIDLAQLADAMCRYDLDQLDVHWLQEINKERRLMGLQFLDEFAMEYIMETLENQCYNNMQADIQTKEGHGIEFDEDVVCEVCRQPDTEDENEMVFCDGCNLGVHQACYGIVKVPEGSWLCKPCTLGLQKTAECILCGRKGGAMKSTRSGHTWAHVICALWIPEIAFADAVRMEPITKVSHVPPSRWALLCSICKERVGACIQCSVKQCVTAYHVTCAVEAKLDMFTDCDVNLADCDAVVFRSYCKKHSKNRKNMMKDSEHYKTRKDSEKDRRKRIMEFNKDFHTFVDPTIVETTINLPSDMINQVMTYWKLKRKANFNAPLIVPKNAENTSAAEAAEMNLKRRLRLFTHIRQDLERVRNLCYMVCRREKLKLAGTKNMENVFLSQMKMLEYRMKQGCYVHSPRLKSMMQNFGKPEVCEVAQKETNLLTRTKYWNPRTPEKKLPKPFRRFSPTALKQHQAKNLALENDVKTIELPATETKPKRRSSSNKTKADEISSKKRDLQKSRRHRTTTDTTQDRAQNTSRFMLRKRSHSSSETDIETENLRPSSEHSPNSKRARLAQGQLFEASFVLSDDNRTEPAKANSSVLVDSSTQNSSVSTKSTAAVTKQSGLKREKSPVAKKSPLKACRSDRLLKRQLRLRRKSSPSYFCAKQYQCYVLY